MQSLLEVSGLPEPSRQRLSALAEGDQFHEPAQLQQAIEAECAYLARLQENGVVQLAGPAPRSPQITGMRTGMDQVGMAFEALLAGSRPPQGVQPLSGIRELYHLLSGDYRDERAVPPGAHLPGERQQQQHGRAGGERPQQAPGERVRAVPAVVDAAGFGGGFLQPAAGEVDHAGRRGRAAHRGRGAAYTELTWDDQTETASFVKKGGYLGLTLEAIDKDDTGRMRAAPRALAQAAWLTLAKAISAVFTDASGAGPTMSDSLALFHSTHGNLGSTALSTSSYAAARTAMRKMTELNSGERLGALTAPKYLLVPPDLEITALQVLAQPVRLRLHALERPGRARERARRRRRQAGTP